jgi:hypothetical protein
MSSLYLERPEWTMVGIRVAVLFVAIGSLAAADVTFEKDVRPILERNCLGCHNDNESKGGLSLSTLASALKGGDSGPAFASGQPDASELFAQVSGSEPAMPKDRPPLTAAELAVLREWIAAGAKWPDGAKLRDRRFDPSQWWSFQPLGRPPVPEIPATLGVSSDHPIDRFILSRLAEKSLTPSPEADRRILIRRLSYDLLGLPPSPEEVVAFVADADPRAYEKLVDRMLQSPWYGERWARHWLDVVHFGETHGYDKDKTREHAWPYRDYVIRAMNEDRPYARFIQEQIAGDVLFPEDRNGLEGPGFISAGPWDFIGHAEVPEEKTDGKIARHLDRDDMITNTIQTFTSLTVQCAQCHDHKFDPITQEDYYSLQAVFAALDRTERRYDADPAVAQQRREFAGRRAMLVSRQGEIEQRVVQKAGPRLKELNDQIAAMEKAPAGQHPLAAQFGWHSGISSQQDSAKWVQVVLAQPTSVATVVLNPCRDDFNNIGDGFGFPARYRVEVSSDPKFEQDIRLVSDQTAVDAPNPKLQPQQVAVGGDPIRVVRVTAIHLAPRLNDFIFSLAELQILDAEGKSLAGGAEVQSLDSIEAAPRWRRTNLIDGYYPGIADSGSNLATLKEERDRLRESALAAEDKATLAAIQKDLASVDVQLAALPAQLLTYVGAIHTGQGNFRGTGPDGGKPRSIRLLNRGNVQSPGPEVEAGAISFFSNLRPRFTEADEQSDGGRRAALSRWITDPQHPLTWRSAVNRVWHYHFGRGLVETPNDFGRNGGLPSHPELLDWLAVEFRDGGGSLKSLHRLIVTSRTYRQVSTSDPQNALADSENRFLWRMNRRRLDAEAVRDSVLAISGKLDLTMYGPSFKDFVIEKPEHSPHYEYHLFDPNDARGHRRSVYRFIVRSQPQPFMTTLDCADPSMQVDRRNESLSPLQALALLNNDLMLAMSEHFAARLAAEAQSLNGQIDRGFRLAVGREPTPEQRDLLVGYAREHGLRNACRVLFNLNEFMFVE